MALYHSARGSVGYTIVGSPTIVDGVASGFSASDYVKTEDNLPSNITSLQIHTEVIKADYPSSPYGIFMVNGYPSIEFQGQIFRIYVLNQDGTNTVYKYQGTPINLNEKVIVDMYWENGATRFVATQGGVTKLDVSYSDTKIASSYITFGRYWTPLNGSIDLKNTYITVNGQPWFGICPIEVKKHQLMGPVGYTVVGSPTITDGVASEFSGNDYLNITSENAIPLSNLNSYTTRVSFTTGNSLAVIEQIIGSTNAFFGFRQATGPQGSLRAVVFDVRNGLFKDLLLTTSLRINTSYIAEQVSNQEECYARFSTDGGVTWTRVDTEGVSSYSISFQTINIGSGTFGAFSGSIDLNATYIKVNGKLWFWQPQETKRIVVNGVEVWTKPE